VAALSRVLEPLARRLRLLVGRARLLRVDDAQPLQQLQLGMLADETGDRVPRMQHYGLTSHPLVASAEAIVLAVGGARTGLVAVAVDDPAHRPRGLAAGEVMLYTDEGDRIHLKRGRVVEVLAGAEVRVSAPIVRAVASTKVRIEAPLAEVTGNVTIGGSLSVTGAIAGSASVSDAAGSMGQMRTVYNGHTHGETGGTTLTPSAPM
jgi:phage baseplate assembly protein V